MSSLLIAVTFCLAQASVPSDRTVAVLPTNQSELGKRLEGHVRTSLTAVNVPLASVAGLREREASQCESNRICASLLGRVLGAAAVVRIEAAVVGTDIAVLIEALDSATGRLIREESFVIPSASVDSELPGRLAPVAAKIQAALPGLAAPKPALAEAKPDVPVANPALDLSAAPIEPRSSFPIWVTGTGAVVFAGASAGLLALGASARNCLHGGPVEGHPTVCVPHSRVAGVQQQADIGLITGTAAAAVAVGLTITAIVQYAASK